MLENTGLLSTPMRAASPVGASGRMVPALVRASRLLDLLGAGGRPLGLAALARDAGLPKSSAHGLLVTLAALGLVERTTQGDFALGPKSLQWAGAYLQGTDLVAAFHDLAGAELALSEETVMLAMLDGADVVYLACRTGTRALTVNFRVGGRFPATVTASGKALLSTLPDEKVEALVRQAGLRPMTPHGVTSAAALMTQLHAVRQRGWALDDEETAAGMNCFGAPVFAAHRPDAIAAVAVSTIKAATDALRRERMVAAIVDLAARLSQRLGAGTAPAWAAAATGAPADATPLTAPDSPQEAT